MTMLKLSFVKPEFIAYFYFQIVSVNKYFNQNYQVVCILMPHMYSYWECYVTWQNQQNHHHIIRFSYSCRNDVHETSYLPYRQCGGHRSSSEASGALVWKCRCIYTATSQSIMTGDFFKQNIVTLQIGVLLLHTKSVWTMIGWCMMIYWCGLDKTWSIFKL
jgi:hypothetical protein